MYSFESIAKGAMKSGMVLHKAGRSPGGGGVIGGGGAFVVLLVYYGDAASMSVGLVLVCDLVSVRGVCVWSGCGVHPGLCDESGIWGVSRDGVPDFRGMFSE
ncbi:hypothetical protein NDU88_004314 [Pleurodeles waltl]|uniref:Uncharacterized protein n=1 Tax=Pleurodeles waltl TaxID=8319 RepID=A0AAV7QC88_PLEWA|nr:hypothetical protein NDU88_004314 [Pleurodeles waltl]